MWYFAWILGLTAAVLLAAMNAMWYEAQENSSADKNSAATTGNEHP